MQRLPFWHFVVSCFLEKSEMAKSCRLQGFPALPYCLRGVLRSI
jgi:hypothetical protein